MKINNFTVRYEHGFIRLASGGSPTKEFEGSPCKDWEVRIRNVSDLRGSFQQLTLQTHKSEAQRNTNGKRSLMQSIHILHLYAHYLLTTPMGFAYMREWAKIAIAEQAIFQ